jgi:hypothetical protein
MTFPTPKTRQESKVVSNALAFILCSELLSTIQPNIDSAKVQREMVK